MVFWGGMQYLKISRGILTFAAVVLIGAGCVASYPTTSDTESTDTESSDPYAGWHEIQAGGVVSFMIPPGCQGDPGAGSNYIVCPTDDNPTPTPEMVISSDGIVVHVRRWEGMESPYWNQVVASMRVLTPVTRDITINIEGGEQPMVPAEEGAYVPMFDGVPAEVGAQVRGMTLESFSCVGGGPDCHYQFSGKAEITGTYHVYDETEAFLGNAVCFDGLDDSSLSRMPYEAGDSRNVWFCFTNEDEARGLFPSNEGTATIVIDDYFDILVGAEVWNTATLVEVISAE